MGTLSLWLEGMADVTRQLWSRRGVPVGQFGGILSPMLETLRAGHASRWVEGQKVLDFGCGRGRLLSKLGGGVSYTGVDHDPTLLSYLRQRFAQARFLCAGLEGLEFPPMSLSTLWSCWR